MYNLLLSRASHGAVPITLVSAKNYKKWLKTQKASTANWLKTLSYKAKPGSFAVIPDVKGKPARVIAALSDPVSMWDVSAMTCPLPKGVYRFEGEAVKEHGEKLALGWLLGAYRFSRYRKDEVDTSRLAIPSGVNAEKVKRIAEAIALVRDLINTPSTDMGPEELADAVVSEGKKYGAKTIQIVGKDLLKNNYPGIYAVGRASSRDPRLVDLVWGNPKHPKITLVGKGVCFDSGGLDLKTSSGMLQMKKDMAGAAIALGVAILVMANKLPVRLRLLIPAAENMISGDAYRPLDVIKMRNGKTVEVANTDAEGRMLLADALAEASREKPELIVDFATLTGAARTALGTEISALFTNDDKLAEDLLEAGKATEDPIWRLPLYTPYDSMLDSKVADMSNAALSPYAGAITGALFLQRFVDKKQSWAHLDFMAWNTSSKAGRPEGGEASSLRAVYQVIENRMRS